jgi:hypothetical protein
MNTFKRLTLWFVLAAIILGPTATGIFPIFPTIVIQTALFVFSVYAFSSPGSTARSKRLAISLVSICLHGEPDHPGIVALECASFDDGAD